MTEWILSIVGGLLITLIVFVIKRSFVLSDRKSEIRSLEMKEQITLLDDNINTKLVDIDKNVNRLNLGLNLVQQDINNNNKDMSEVKTRVGMLEKKHSVQLDKHDERIRKNAENIVRQEERYNSCPGKNIK